MSRSKLVVVALVVCVVPAAPVMGQKIAPAGDGVIYVGTYANKIYKVSESTMRVVDSIPISIGIPTGLLLSANRKHIYVGEPRNEKFEVIDLATKKSLDIITLTDEDRRVMLWGANVDPQERFAVFLIKTYQKKNDRWLIGKPTMVKYDLARKVVTDTIPWPKGEERDFSQILFSPNGDLMYFFGTDVLIYDTQTLKQVDRWELGRSLDDGMGRFNFGFPEDVFEEPGFYTGLFQVSDPVQHRSLMGVARVDLVKRQVDVFTLGPTEQLRAFALAPGKRRAYGLRSTIGTYEFWSFDLENRRVIGKTPFKGRPRMGLAVSSNGKYLYIHTAGPTIDLYDTERFKLVRTVDLGADMTDFLLIPPTPTAPAR